MKKYFFNISVAVLCFVLIVALLEYRYKNYQTPVDDLFGGINEEIHGINKIYIGGSHTGALGTYSEHTEDKIRNLSFQGLDLFKQYAMLKKYCPKATQLRKVYIGLDYEMLGQNQALSGEEYLDRQFYKYIDTLYKDNFTNRLMSNSNFYRANRDLSFLFKKPDRKISKKELNFIPVTASKKINLADCKKRAIEHSIIKFRTELMAQNLGYLRAIVDFSKTQNIELIIFNPPKRECFCENVKAETSYLARQKIDSLLTAEHLIYYDFWRDTAFKETDFADYDHLNFEGAKKLIHRLN